jgi:hypothetical protein
MKMVRCYLRIADPAFEKLGKLRKWLRLPKFA